MAASFQGRRGSLVSQIKGALTEANYCWPAVSVGSCLIAAVRSSGVSSFSKPLLASAKEVFSLALEQPISSRLATIIKTTGDQGSRDHGANTGDRIAPRRRARQ